MGNVFTPSGKSQRNIAIAQETQRQKELAEQREEAQRQQIPALQETLLRDTNRLNRIFNARALLAGGSLRLPGIVSR